MAGIDGGVCRLEVWPGKGDGGDNGHRNGWGYSGGVGAWGRRQDVQLVGGIGGSNSEVLER